MFSLNKNRLDVETRIAPPMKQAITVPVKRDGKETGIIIYVCEGAFNPRNPVSREMLEEVAARLAVNYSPVGGE